MSTIKVTNLRHESATSNNIALDSSGNAAFQAGTVGAPAIQATGDSNTGIYFPAADNIGFTTGGTIRGRWTTDGLCFNADTAAVNALDDYEEGTWTPIIESGYSAITYGNQAGWYVRIGNFVLISARIQFTGTANSSTILMSCPFAASSTTLGYGGGGIPFSDISVITNTDPYINNSNSNVRFYTKGTGTAISSSGNVSSQWISYVISIFV